MNKFFIEKQKNETQISRFMSRHAFTGKKSV